MNLKHITALLLGCLLLSGCGSKPPESTVPVQTTLSDTEAVPALAPVTETTASAVTQLTPEEYFAMPAGTMLEPDQLTPETVSALFHAAEIDDTVFARINGVSYHENPDITRADLRYLRVLHYTPAAEVHIGELICNQAIADELLEIFRHLYDAQYPIEKMHLIDDYNGDDEASMADNNSCCFNYRDVTDSSDLSMHARGLAVDINPLYNPYVAPYPDGSRNIRPRSALPYIDRKSFFPMKITHDDFCFEQFTLHGYDWGGDWRDPVDYQHFEKVLL